MSEPAPEPRVSVTLTARQMYALSLVLEQHAGLMQIQAEALADPVKARQMDAWRQVSEALRLDIEVQH